MTVVRKPCRQSAYHASAYQFVFAALNHVQDTLGRDRRSDQSGHVSGPELLAGIRELALQHFGLMTLSVFSSWGITRTEDFGKIVFELVEIGRMRKTNDDQLDDFVGVYDFHQAFNGDYDIDTSVAFQEQSPSF